MKAVSTTTHSEREREREEKENEKKSEDSENNKSLNEDRGLVSGKGRLPWKNDRPFSFASLDPVLGFTGKAAEGIYIYVYMYA